MVKECMIETAKLLCPESVENFRKIPLSNNTNTRRSEVLAGDVKNKLISTLKTTNSISLAIDESSDLTDVAQLSIFVRFVDEEVCIFREELLVLLPLNISTQGKDIHNAIVHFFDTMRFPPII